MRLRRGLRDDGDFMSKNEGRATAIAIVALCFGVVGAGIVRIFTTNILYIIVGFAIATVIAGTYLDHTLK